MSKTLISFQPSSLATKNTDPQSILANTLPEKTLMILESQRSPLLTNFFFHPLQAQSQPHRQGSKPTSIRQLSRRWAWGLSLLTHITVPFAIKLAWALLAMVLLFLFNLDLGDWFKKPPTQAPVIEFVIVPDTKTKDPKASRFLGEFAQAAGGKKVSQKPRPKELAAPRSTEPLNESVKLGPQSSAEPIKPPLTEAVPKATSKTETRQEKPLIKPNEAPISKPNPTKTTTEETPVIAESLTQTPEAQALKPASALESLAAIMGTGESPTPVVGETQQGDPAKSGVDVQASPDFAPYMADLKQRLAKNWHPPRGRKSRRVILRFDIAKDGLLKEVWVQDSSGTQEVDEAAIQAVRLSSPFKAFPESFREEILPILFTFDYTIYGF